MNDIDMHLCFVNYVGEEANGLKQYEFCFTSTPDEFWGENFEYTPCCLINDLKPDDKYISMIRILRTELKLDLIQNNCCFGMQDCLDGIVALCHENISDYSEYPEEGRLYFMFGEGIDEVEQKLAAKNLLFDETIKI
jgi:hypothetical protein